MDGEPSGIWDDGTRAAMMRFQGDNGWQTKVVPDSRALIKLGLGPNHENALNRESSVLKPAPVLSSAPAVQLQPGGAAANQ